MYTLKKSLGQHFLRDEQVCQKIVELLTYPSGLNLLEVGPGGGALTKYLMTKEGINYLAVEVDREKVDFLVATYPSLSGKIIQQDILTTTVPFAGDFTLIGNFPYNISSQILFRVLEWEEQVQMVIGMFQKEVGARIACGPGSKEYGILSVLVQAFYKVEYLFDVHENCFNPPPKVKSGVLRFTNLHNPWGITEKKRFMILVKAAFGQRRKTLRNALKSTLPPSMLLLPVMEKRAEQLSVAQFVELYKQMVGHGKS